MTLELERPGRTEAFTADFFGAALRGEPCTVHGLEELPHRLSMTRWTQPADHSDAALLARCAGPVLDVGCGPGRMSEHLATGGIGVLGIDIVPEAVAQTRARGATALHRDVFDPLPGEGGWTSALLADGNIGIGGDPVTLLRRVADVLAPGGTVVADLAPPGAGLSTHTLELECGGFRSAPFPWTLVGPESVDDVSRASGMSVGSLNEHDGRWFVVLVKEC